MFVLIECNPDRVSIIKELAGRVYGTRVLCTSPDLCALPDKIEDAVIADAKARYRLHLGHGLRGAEHGD